MNAFNSIKQRPLKTRWIFSEHSNLSINGIEHFGDKAKHHRRKFSGISTADAELPLKACDWRFNTPSTKSQFTLLKQRVKDKFTPYLRQPLVFMFFNVF